MIDLLRAAPDAAVLLEGERGRLLFANRAFAARVGAPADALAGRPWREILPGALAEQVQVCLRIEEVIEAHHVEDGRTLEHRIVPLPGDGDTRPVAVFSRDVTDQRQRAGLLAAQRLTRTGSWELDLATSTFTASDELHRIFGVDAARGRLTFEGLLALVHPDDRRRVEEVVRRTAEAGAPFDLDHRLLTSGAARWARHRGEVLRDEGRGRVVAAVQELEGRGPAGEDGLTALGATYELQALFGVEGATVRVTALNAAAQAAARRVGVEVGGGADLTTLGALGGEEHRLAERVVRVATSGASERYEGTFALPRGDLTLEATLTRLPGGDDRVRQVLWSGRDVTAQARARDELRLHSEILLAMGEGALLFDGLGTILFANRALHEMYGYAPGELVGTQAGVLSGLPPAETERVAGAVRASLGAQGGYEGEFVGRRKDGSAFVSLARFSPIRRDDRSLVVCIVSDVTARQHVEAQLRSSLREKETLLREVHHRVKNNLQIICSLLALQRSTSPGEAAARVILDCEERVRAIAMIHELLYQSEDLHEVDLGAYARKVVSAMSAAYAHAASFEVAADGGMGVPLDTAVPLGFVLHELLSNAAKHAFPAGRTGRVRVGLACSGEALTLAVEDDGVGLPPDWAARVHTTLGLSLVRALTDQLDGSFELATGTGTAARLVIPSPSRPGSRRPPRPTPSPR